jgi:hypothetical protein
VLTLTGVENRSGNVSFGRRVGMMPTMPGAFHGGNGPRPESVSLQPRHQNSALKAPEREPCYRYVLPKG